MPGRVMLAALALSVVTLSAACSSSSPPTRGSTAPTRPAPTKQVSAESSAPRTTSAAEPGLAPPTPAADSPALGKYDRETVTAVLDLATHLAYYSVADPTLLGKVSTHTSVTDYSDITRYLTPQGTAYLTSYVKDQDHNGKHAVIAGQLALANVSNLSGVSKSVDQTKGTRFSAPFTPRNYSATINPSVGLGQDGITMVVSGRCSVEIPGTRDGKPVLVTFARKSFTYYVQPSPSKAYPVGVSGWVSARSATYKPA